MEVTVSFTMEVDGAIDITEILSMLDGDVKATRKKRDKQPMPDGPAKDAIKHRFAVGRIDAALERGEDPRPQDLEFVEEYEAGIEYDEEPEPDPEVAAAEALGEELAENSKAAAAKKPASKKKKSRKKAAKK